VLQPDGVADLVHCLLLDAGLEELAIRGAAEELRVEACRRHERRAAAELRLTQDEV
jgi:hypothetical protein